MDSSRELMQKLDTYEKVEEYYFSLGKPMLVSSIFDNFPMSIGEKFQAFYKIKILEEVFNQGWKPNWDDRNERKYYPYFQKTSSGWVFFDSIVFGTLSYGQVGFYKNKEIADFIGRNFLYLYVDLLK